MPNVSVDYSDIDELEKNQNSLLEQQTEQSNRAIDIGIQQQENLAQKQKQEYDEEATKTAKGLYANYKKASNPYGATQEQMAEQGLGGSGYAESSQINLYNDYQKNLTTTITENNKLKAKTDFNLNQAYLEADIQKAQNAVQQYEIKMNLLLQNYQLRYQKYRDAVADEQWERSFVLQQQQANNSQSQWEAEYQLSLQKLANSSSKKKSSSGSNSTVLTLGGNTTKNNNTSSSNESKKTTKNKNLLEDPKDFNSRR